MAQRYETRKVKWSWPYAVCQGGKAEEFTLKLDACNTVDMVSITIIDPSGQENQLFSLDLQRDDLTPLIELLEIARDFN